MKFFLFALLISNVVLSSQANAYNKYKRHQNNSYNHTYNSNHQNRGYNTSCSGKIIYKEMNSSRRYCLNRHGSRQHI